MKTSIHLNESDIKKAVAHWLKSEGYTVTGDLYVKTDKDDRTGVSSVTVSVTAEHIKPSQR